MFAATVFDPEWQHDNHVATAKSLWDKMVFQLPLFAVDSKYDVRMLLYSGWLFNWLMVMIYFKLTWAQSKSAQGELL